MGDLNVDFLQENNPLQEVLHDYGLTNIIEGPTCFKNLDKPTLNDVILTNCPRKIASTLNVNIGMSDHHNHIQAATRLFAPRSEKQDITYRTYKNFNEDEFLEDLKNSLSLSIFDNVDCENSDHVTIDVNKQSQLHSDVFRSVIDRHAPLKRRKIKPNQLLFMNSKLRKAINVKGMLRRWSYKYRTKYITKCVLINRII
jgi:hypothetical protein